MVVDVVAEEVEVDGGISEDTLFRVDDEPVLGEAGEQCAKMLHVFGHVPVGHQDIVEVDKQERQVGEDCLHQPLKCLGCVLEAKRHAEELKRPNRVMTAVLAMLSECMGT